MTGRRALSLVVMGSLLAEGVALAQQAPPPTPPWSKFVRTKGHDVEIPAHWVETPEGRMAHDIVLPGSLPKTVPFDFDAAKKKANQRGGKTVSKQYWEHLCSTEAGSFVLNAVDNVEGFYFMRAIRGFGDEGNESRWKEESPGVQSRWPIRYSEIELARLFISPPLATYKWIDAPNERGAIVRMSGYVEGSKPMATELRPKSDAQHGITWRGIRRERDREHAIAGLEWIAIDRSSGQVLAVLRDFFLTGLTTNRPDGISWLNAPRCDYAKTTFARAGDLMDIRFWAPMVLKPSTYPGVLKLLDERRAAK